MKTTRLLAHRVLWAAAILAGAGLAGGTAAAGATPVDRANGDEIIRGEIAAVTTDQLTLENGAIIAISAETSCIQNGQTLLLSDLAVGDRVRIEAFHDSATDQRQAVLIEVVARPGAGGGLSGGGY